jgi:hypothetical protein
MYRYPFNPFTGPIEKVEAHDLSVLRTVAEGWYVDYKRESIKIDDLAKQLSAFSNQYGGFLFIGITEAQDGSRKAETFEGIPQEDIPPLSLRVREAAVTHVNPPVLYEERVIEGPCDEIGLPAGRAILILGIPQGTNPPYIHSSGRVYRRLADQSKPKEETDRYTLDNLWRRGQESQRQLSEFLRRTPEVPNIQENVTWAFIYAVPDANLPAPPTLSFEQYRLYTAQCGENMRAPRISMESVHPTHDGYIARQTKGNYPGYGCLGLRWWHSGIARMEIPTNVYPFEEFVRRQKEYRHGENFVSELRKQGLTRGDLMICDFSHLLTCLLSLSNTYLHLRWVIGDNRTVHTAHELRNVFYRVPFVDSLSYVERASSYGIPVIQDRIIRQPENPYMDNMLSLPTETDTLKASDTDTIIKAAALFAGPIAFQVLLAAGIVGDPKHMEDPEIWGSPTVQG